MSDIAVDIGPDVVRLSALRPAGSQTVNKVRHLYPELEVRGVRDMLAGRVSLRIPRDSCAVRGSATECEIAQALTRDGFYPVVSVASGVAYLIPKDGPHAGEVWRVQLRNSSRLAASRFDAGQDFGADVAEFIPLSPANRSAGGRSRGRVGTGVPQGEGTRRRATGLRGMVGVAAAGATA